MTKLQMKWAAVIALLAASIYCLYPTINWYQLDAQERAKQEAMRLRPKSLLNLGLDLKGGTHLMMEIEVEKLPPNSDIGDAISRAIETIRNRISALPAVTRWMSPMIDLPWLVSARCCRLAIGALASPSFGIVIF